MRSARIAQRGSAGSSSWPAPIRSLNLFAAGVHVTPGCAKVLRPALAVTPCCVATSLSNLNKPMIDPTITYPCTRYRVVTSLGNGIVQSAEITKDGIINGHLMIKYETIPGLQQWWPHQLVEERHLRVVLPYTTLQEAQAALVQSLEERCASHKTVIIDRVRLLAKDEQQLESARQLLATYTVPVTTPKVPIIISSLTPWPHH